MAMMLVQNTTVAQEQTRGKERPTPEQMAQMKADRIAAELALDDKTSEKFKETYKAYMTDKAAIRNEFKSEKGQKGMSDADIEKSILDGFDKKQKNLDLDRKYYEKFRKFMGPRTETEGTCSFTQRKASGRTAEQTTRTSTAKINKKSTF